MACNALSGPYSSNALVLGFRKFNQKCNSIIIKCGNIFLKALEILE
jgi:hypothetical protein